MATGGQDRQSVALIGSGSPRGESVPGGTKPGKSVIFAPPSDAGGGWRRLLPSRQAGTTVPASYCCRTHVGVEDPNLVLESWLDWTVPSGGAARRLEKPVRSVMASGGCGCVGRQSVRLGCQHERGWEKLVSEPLISGKKPAVGEQVLRLVVGDLLSTPYSLSTPHGLAAVAAFALIAVVVVPMHRPEFMPQGVYSISNAGSSCASTEPFAWSGGHCAGCRPAAWKVRMCRPWKATAQFSAGLQFVVRTGWIGWPEFLALLQHFTREVRRPERRPNRLVKMLA